MLIVWEWIQQALCVLPYIILSLIFFCCSPMTNFPFPFTEKEGTLPILGFTKIRCGWWEIPRWDHPSALLEMTERDVGKLHKFRELWWNDKFKNRNDRFGFWEDTSENFEGLSLELLPSETRSRHFVCCCILRKNLGFSFTFRSVAMIHHWIFFHVVHGAAFLVETLILNNS